MTDERDTSKLHSIAGQVIPVAIKDIRASRGGLRIGPVRKCLALDFLYRGARFEASVEMSGPSPAATVRAVFGTLPFSAESPQGRRAALVAIKGGKASGSSLSADQIVRAETTVPLDIASLTPTMVVAALVEGVMRLKPLLEQLRAMIHPAVGGPGLPKPVA
jgi:hypothetical protein